MRDQPGGPRVADLMRINHNDYYLALLPLVAARGTCVRREVAAIIVDEQHRILSTGYNGVPRGQPHCFETACPGGGDKPGDSSRCAAVHAEINALLQCSRLDLAYTLYISCTPCYSCAKAICNTPIKQIICREEYAEGLGLSMLHQAGIMVIVAK